MEKIEQKLDEILDVLKNLDIRMQRIETSKRPLSDTKASSVKPAGQRKISIKEFLLECKPNGDAQKTLAIAYFLETHEGIPSFNKADLEKGYRSAKEPVPSNINDKVYRCIKNGHMMEDKEKKDNTKAWVITSSGENFLKEGFSRK